MDFPKADFPNIPDKTDLRISGKEREKKIGTTLSKVVQIAQEENMKLIRPKEAAALMCVSVTTLRRFANKGILSEYRTPGAHRRYNADEITRILTGSPRQLDQAEQEAR